MPTDASTTRRGRLGGHPGCATLDRALHLFSDLPNDRPYDLAAREDGVLPEASEAAGKDDLFTKLLDETADRERELQFVRRQKLLRFDEFLAGNARIVSGARREY